ncbi:MAG: tetratricopeptide repeat protein, partial [Desulfobacterales bacterium]|nr:tetratricopeptide repeat protein [Desulfobacterales bacterium]
LGRHTEAETAYRQAVTLNPDATNVFSLGQLFLNTDRPAQAMDQFEKVVDLTPENVNGYYGMGQAFGKMGDPEEAVKQFEKAIELQADFYSSYAELGYLYADMGQPEDAQAMFEILEEKDPALADTLSRYMYKAEAPRIEFASSDSTFSYTLPSKTTLTALDSYLVNANTSKKFSMIFQFGKGMDMDSVQNRFNWQISRSTKTDPGQMYNNGLDLPSTEITVPPIPEIVTYDPTSYQATVYFNISQNSALADGTLDPSHLVFKFSGKDEFGNTMDPDGDEYMGAVGRV